MLEEIKILLGDAAGNFTDAQIGLCAKQALACKPPGKSPA